MADNVPITAGSGTTVGTDDISGVHYQFVKLADGTLDSTNKAIINASGELLVKISTATATVSVASASALDVSAATVNVAPVLATTGTITTVAASATSVTLKISNPSRKSIVIVNDSTATLYVATAATPASTSVYTVKLDAGGTYEDYGYSGEIRGIWSSATGNARITERA